MNRAAKKLSLSCRYAFFAIISAVLFSLNSYAIWDCPGWVAHNAGQGVPQHYSSLTPRTSAPVPGAEEQKDKTELSLPDMKVLKGAREQVQQVLQNPPPVEQRPKIRVSTVGPKESAVLVFFVGDPVDPAEFVVRLREGWRSPTWRTEVVWDRELRVGAVLVEGGAHQAMVEAIEVLSGNRTVIGGTRSKDRDALEWQNSVFLNALPGLSVQDTVFDVQFTAF